MPLLRCRSCGLVQAAERPAPAELQTYYARYSYENEAVWRTSPATEAALDRLAARLAEYRALGTALDVGCGAGVVLRCFRRHGWAVEGTELSTLAAERLRQEGFLVHAGDLESLGLRGGSFDVVIMSEIVEHLPEPRRALVEAHSLLRLGGALYLTTPNIDSLARRVLGGNWRVIGTPEHLSYFDRASLRRLLTAVGFEIVAISTDGLNPFDLWAGLHPHRGRPPAAMTAARTEALRGMAMQSGPVSAAKSLVNALLGVSGLGDTLKALATKG